MALDGEETATPQKKGPSGKRMRLKRVLRRPHKPDLSVSRSQLIKALGLNSSANRSMLHKSTLRANNKALAQALENAKQEVRMVNEVLMEKTKENQALLVRLSNLERVAGIQNNEIENEVQRRFDVKMLENRALLNKVSSQLLDTVQLLGRALDVTNARNSSIGSRPVSIGSRPTSMVASSEEDVSPNGAPQNPSQRSIFRPPANVTKRGPASVACMGSIGPAVVPTQPSFSLVPPGTLSHNLSLIAEQGQGVESDQDNDDQDIGDQGEQLCNISSVPEAVMEASSTEQSANKAAAKTKASSSFVPLRVLRIENGSQNKELLTEDEAVKGSNEDHREKKSEDDDVKKSERGKTKKSKMETSKKPAKGETLESEEDKMLKSGENTAVKKSKKDQVLKESTLRKSVKNKSNGNSDDADMENNERRVKKPKVTNSAFSAAESIPDDDDDTTIIVGQHITGAVNSASVADSSDKPMDVDDDATIIIDQNVIKSLMGKSAGPVNIADQGEQLRTLSSGTEAEEDKTKMSKQKETSKKPANNTTLESEEDEMLKAGEDTAVKKSNKDKVLKESITARKSVKDRSYGNSDAADIENNETTCRGRKQKVTNSTCSEKAQSEGAKSQLPIRRAPEVQKHDEDETRTRRGTFVIPQNPNGYTESLVENGKEMTPVPGQVGGKTGRKYELPSVSAMRRGTFVVPPLVSAGDSASPVNTEKEVGEMPLENVNSSQHQNGTRGVNKRQTFSITSPVQEKKKQATASKRGTYFVPQSEVVATDTTPDGTNGVDNGIGKSSKPYPRDKRMTFVVPNAAESIPDDDDDATIIVGQHITRGVNTASAGKPPFADSSDQPMEVDDDATILIDQNLLRGLTGKSTGSGPSIRVDISNEERIEDEDDGILIDNSITSSEVRQGVGLSLKDNASKMPDNNQQSLQPSFPAYMEEEDATTYFNADMEFTETINFPVLLHTAPSGNRVEINLDNKSSEMEAPQEIPPIHGDGENQLASKDDGSAEKMQTDDFGPDKSASRAESEVQKDAEKPELTRSQVEVRMGKPGNVIFAAGRKDADGIRQAVPAKLPTKARSKQKKPSKASVAKSAGRDSEKHPSSVPPSIFDYHDRTPVVTKERTAPQHGLQKSVFEMSMNESAVQSKPACTFSDFRKKVSDYRKTNDKDGVPPGSSTMVADSGNSVAEATKKTKARSRPRSKDTGTLPVGSSEDSSEKEEHPPKKVRTKSKTKTKAVREAVEETTRGKRKGLVDQHDDEMDDSDEDFIPSSQNAKQASKKIPHPVKKRTRRSCSVGTIPELKSCLRRSVSVDVHRDAEVGTRFSRTRTRSGRQSITTQSVSDSEGDTPVKPVKKPKKRVTMLVVSSESEEEEDALSSDPQHEGGNDSTHPVAVPQTVIHETPLQMTNRKRQGLRMSTDTEINTHLSRSSGPGVHDEDEQLVKSAQVEVLDSDKENAEVFKRPALSDTKLICKRTSTELVEEFDQMNVFGGSGEEGKRRRRGASAVCYTEPKIGSKLRQGDKHTSTVYEGQEHHLNIEMRKERSRSRGSKNRSLISKV